MQLRSMWTSSVIENTHIIHEYMANSLPRDSDQMKRIQAAVKKAGLFVVLGYSERDGGAWRGPRFCEDPSLSDVRD